MAKLSLPLFKKTTPFDQKAPVKKPLRPGAAAGALALLFGIAAFAVLPLLNALDMGSLLADTGVPSYALPVALAVLALVCGFKGEGGAALAGKILGVLCLLLVGLCAAVTQFAPQFNHLVQPVYRLAGLEEPVAVSSVTGKPVPEIELKPAVNPDSPADALVFTQNIVAERVSQGVELNQITEALTLNDTQQKYWLNVSILQGAINATPVDGEKALVMLPLQEGKQITWICSGEVPQQVRSLCGE